MGYEVIRTYKEKCKCGNGYIKKYLKQNDWNQFDEDVVIECEECNKKCKIISKYFCPKPAHDYTIYYLEDKETGEKTQIDFN